MSGFIYSVFPLTSVILIVAILLGKNQKKISSLLNTQALNKIMGTMMLFFAAILFFSII